MECARDKIDCVVLPVGSLVSHQKGKLFGETITLLLEILQLVA